MVRRNARPTDVAGIGRKRALVPSTVTGQRMTIRRYTVCFRDGRHPHDPRCRPPPSCARPAAIRPHRALAAHPRGVSLEALAPRAVHLRRRPPGRRGFRCPSDLHRRRRRRHRPDARAARRLRDPRDAGVDVQGRHQPDGLRCGRPEGRTHPDARLPRRLPRLGRRTVARADRPGALDEAVDLLVLATGHAGARAGTLPAVHDRLRLRQRRRDQSSGRTER